MWLTNSYVFCEVKTNRSEAEDDTTFYTHNASCFLVSNSSFSWVSTFNKNDAFPVIGYNSKVSHDNSTISRQSRVGVH